MVMVDVKLNMKFVNDYHKIAFEQALEKAGLNENERLEIVVPLYVLTSIPSLQEKEKLSKVFNFEGIYFDPDNIYDLNLSSGENVLALLAINLYNGYVAEDENLSPYYAMSWLSKEYKEVYVQALKYRFL